jgi:putative transposase
VIDASAFQLLLALLIGWSGEVRRLLGDGGIRVVQTPRRAPNANAHAERFVRSIKHECLDRVIPLGERHFQQTRNVPLLGPQPRETASVI